MYRIYAGEQLVEEHADRDEAFSRFLAVIKMDEYRRCYVRILDPAGNVAQEAYPAISGWQPKEAR